MSWTGMKAQLHALASQICIFGLVLRILLLGTGTTMTY